MYFLSRFWKLLILPPVKTGTELHQESPATAQVSRRKISPPGQVTNLIFRPSLQSLLPSRLMLSTFGE